MACPRTDRAHTNTFVPLTDVLGSTLGLVNSSGGLATQYTYEPFGVPTTSSQSGNYPYLFAGMEYDATTGLYHTPARYYSPRLQRFYPGIGFAKVHDASSGISDGRSRRS